MVSFRVKEDRDNGFEAFFTGLRSLKGKRVKVGIQGRAGAEIRPGGISMVGLGIIHEFGHQPSNIPQRSFLRSTADAKKRKYELVMVRSIRKLVKDPKSFNAEGELFRLGERVRADIIKTIKARIPPPLKPATIARKGEDVPLIDKGLLIGSIRSVVTG